jgi:hypothetical protein
MKYVVEKGSDAMICVPSFINIDSDTQKLIWRDIQTHRQHGEITKAYFYFFKIRKVG